MTPYGLNIRDYLAHLSKISKGRPNFKAGGQVVLLSHQEVDFFCSAIDRVVGFILRMVLPLAIERLPPVANWDYLHWDTLGTTEQNIFKSLWPENCHSLIDIDLVYLK